MFHGRRPGPFQLFQLLTGHHPCCFWTCMNSITPDSYFVPEAGIAAILMPVLMLASHISSLLMTTV